MTGKRTIFQYTITGDGEKMHFHAQRAKDITFAEAIIVSPFARAISDVETFVTREGCEE